MIDADASLARLKEGNERFSSDAPSQRYSARARAASVAGQRPFAIVIGCSDSRVPVEAVFDAGVGEVFVVRTAGHVLTAASLASVRFAVEKLGARLIVVLGHEDCGAVSAALAGGTPEWLAPIVDKIDVTRVDPTTAPDDADDPVLAAAVDLHVCDTVDEVSAFVSGFSEGVAVVGAAYRLASGRVHWLGGRDTGA